MHGFFQTPKASLPSPRHAPALACRRGSRPLLAALVCWGLAPAPHAAELRDETDPLPWLRLESVLDGRCHNLSEGGKLTVMHNEHPSRVIRYRLMRLHVDRPQGLIDGSIKPGEPAQKLGCDKVGGRAQTWQIKRAQFVSE